jgi:hypothetical protein
MAAQPWQWKRLTDEQLEAAAVHWVDLAGAAYYAHERKSTEARERVVSQIIDEMNRRCAQPRLFEDRPGYGLYGAA